MGCGQSVDLATCVGKRKRRLGLSLGAPRSSSRGPPHESHTELQLGRRLATWARRRLAAIQRGPRSADRTLTAHTQSQETACARDREVVRT
eukprot:742861-Prymnesium_polylepis.1